ncbi:hypothetical protein ABIE78_000538 [Sinorhizobium fredii]
MIAGKILEVYSLRTVTAYLLRGVGCRTLLCRHLEHMNACRSETTKRNPVID